MNLNTLFVIILSILSPVSSDNGSSSSSGEQTKLSKLISQLNEVELGVEKTLEKLIEILIYFHENQNSSENNQLIDIKLIRQLIDMSNINDENCENYSISKYQVIMIEHLSIRLNIAPYIEHYARAQNNHCLININRIIENIVYNKFNDNDKNFIKLILDSNLALPIELVLREKDSHLSINKLGNLIRRTIHRSGPRWMTSIKDIFDYQLEELIEICTKISSLISPMVSVYDHIDEEQSVNVSSLSKTWIDGANMCDVAILLITLDREKVYEAFKNGPSNSN